MASYRFHVQQIADYFEGVNFITCPMPTTRWLKPYPRLDQLGRLFHPASP
jgi:hypothetical protein